VFKANVGERISPVASWQRTRVPPADPRERGEHLPRAQQHLEPSVCAANGDALGRALRAPVGRCGLWPRVPRRTPDLV